MSRTLTSALVIIFTCATLVSTNLSARAQGTAPAPATAQTATVTGKVSDESGAPIAGAKIELRGITPKATVSDAAGNFTVSGLTAGFYVVAASKAGYTTAIQNDVALFSGETTTLAIQMGLVTFSSLRTIASVRTSSHALNTTPASVNVVNTSTFIDQGQPQVTRVLSQVPGLQISFPSNSANAAAPGAITVPNIRAATSYETASLIDGHYISVGQYGDNVTTFLNAFMFGNIEVVKGPGADAPIVNNAIGGTTNFRTKDPTATLYTQALFGVDNHGGSLSNFEYSNTIGRLGVVVDFATDNNQSALFGKSVYYDPSANGATLNGTPLTSNGSIYNQVGNTQSYLPTAPQMLACCWTLDGSMDQTAELIKFRYKLSQSTRLTLSYLGNQTTADQNGNTSNLYDSVFTPGPGYAGPLAAGSNIQYSTIYPGAPQGEYNNEPIYQAEMSSTVGNDSLLARYYNATISRFQWGGLNPIGYDFNNVTLYGTNGYYDNNGNYVYTTNFNGTNQNVQYYDYYKEPELDKLHGESFEYSHPFAGNDVLTFSGDWTNAASSDWSAYSASYCTPLCYSFSLPPGTHQSLNTYMLRGQFYLGPKLSATLSDYFNTYSSTFAINCPMDPFGNCTQDAAVNGTGVTFATTNNTHNDPRLGLVFRPTAASSIRLSLGSSVAPPFVGVLSQVNTPPTYNSAYQVAFETNTHGNIKPETAFGYDIGGDYSFKDGTIVSADGYLTNLFNRFFNQSAPTGLVCGGAVTCANDPNTGSSAPPGTPIFNQFNTNISNARFEGVELSVRRTPAAGLGYTVAGAIQRGYYYNLPPYFYCSAGASQPSSNPGVTPAGCIPANYDQNLNIISGQNTNGLPVGFYNINYNGNMRIPFAQGNAEINYAFPGGSFIALGTTYYGKNNSLNRPPFEIGYATLRVPISRALAFQISGDNIFNTYSGILPVYGAGVPISLANGGIAATNGNVLGPATWRFMITTRP